MEILYERCAGLDIGKAEVVACIRVPDGAGGRRAEVRTFGTFTGRLEALADWLTSEGFKDLVMEATGQYWKPVWYVLEERGLELLLVNARHVRILPGRKTDVGDAAWLAELLEHPRTWAGQRSASCERRPRRSWTQLYRRQTWPSSTMSSSRTRSASESTGRRLDAMVRPRRRVARHNEAG